MDQVLGFLHSSSEENDWDDLVKQLDTNHDGKIDYGEFISAAVNRARLINEDNLRLAFNMFDKDGNGLIDRDELRAVFYGGNSQMDEEDEALWSQVMAEVDRNNDNQISCSEFNEAMMEVLEHRSKQRSADSKL